jgi:hypothetical protein
MRRRPLGLTGGLRGGRGSRGAKKISSGHSLSIVYLAAKPRACNLIFSASHLKINSRKQFTLAVFCDILITLW